MGMEFEGHGFNAEDFSSKVESAEKRDSVASLSNPRYPEKRNDYIQVYNSKNTSPKGKKSKS
jgi:hypothetical protein